MALQPWWTGYPQQVWADVDWQRWHDEGEPHLPRDVRLPRFDTAEPSLPRPEPRHRLPSGVRWVGPAAQKRKGPRDARGKSIDAMLAKLGIGGR
jgi:hypothetical protein